MVRRNTLVGLVSTTIIVNLAIGFTAAADTPVVADGTPAAMAILGFLNDPDTTYDTLAMEVALDGSVARSLIDHRNGFDGIPGTGDDNPFDSIEEVDSAQWAGLETLDRLRTHVQCLELVPSGRQLLGVYEGVTFTVTEAEAVVRYVNWASESTLDRVLNVRAVNSIVQARPIESVQELSTLYYVGAGALARLKELAMGGAS